MKEIVVKSILMQNFKKFTEKRIEFNSKMTEIFGQNYKGKSSVADAFSWVMFNKSSTGNTEGSQFRPRRYDENGKNIDHVDVVVELVLLVDGVEWKIKKTQRQEWVRHRGDSYDSYEGDKTEYEWNDVPVTPTNHKKKVEEIISEEIFRMISNPAAFPALAAKKQREFLLTNVANITDEDVFASNPEFELVKDAMGNKSLEELVAKNKKEITAYKKKQEELPIRIDQESKRIDLSVDFSEKEKELSKMQADLADVEKRLEDTGKAYEEVNNLKIEKEHLKSELIRAESAISRENDYKRREIRNLVDVANDEFNECNSKHTRVESASQIHKARIESKEKELAKLKEKYLAENSKELADDAYICPTCGQELPEDKREEIKADFNTNKAARLNSINKEGQLLSSELKTLKDELTSYENEIEELKNKKIEAMGKKNRYQSVLDNFVPEEKENNPAWQEVHNKITAIDSKISAINTEDADKLKQSLKNERTQIQQSIDEVKETLALKTVIEKSKAAIEELKAELTQVTQSLANCEQLESQIEKFNRAKMDLLSERINDKFKIVKWRLFEQQKNGRFAETCVCMVNGSCYGENTTSATERMMAGMDIINTLQTIYQVKAPIFLDDADLYNNWNVPEMDCQLIKLCVSEDEELRVEGV